MKQLAYALMLLLLSAGAGAEKFYADVVFEIGESGVAYITGETNHPDLKEGPSDQMTYKNGPYWIFKFTEPGNFSDFVYEVRLPKGTTINYIKATTPVRIGIDQQRTILKASGRDKPMGITVQYNIDSVAGSNLLIYGVAGAILFGATGLLILNRRGAAPVHIVKLKPWYNKDTLTERQKEIVEILEKRGRAITQKGLEDILGIPKSSLSRNIDALVRKGILTKEEKGMTNAISLIEKKPEI